MARSIKLIGLDCGSTTTSAIVASARLTTSALGRVEISQLTEIFRSNTVLTPFAGESIDEKRIESYLDSWLAAAGAEPAEIVGGGALITGLAAQRHNAGAITEMIERRLNESVIATADDPCLESWLAFMGNCREISKAHPGTPILNLDIGGGTTNLALGIDGQVISTGCLFVGARHVQFVPGTYQIVGLSPYAIDLFAHLGIKRRVGETLDPAELESVVDFYVGLIAAAVEGQQEIFATLIGRRHLQVPMSFPEKLRAPVVVTLSGGVGQLVYGRQQGDVAHGISRFGDLGDELAERILRCSAIVDRLSTTTPEGLGRATVYGLLRHSTELSGSTLYLPDPLQLPLKNVPIIGRLGVNSSDEQLTQALGLAARSWQAACIQIELDPNSDDVRRLGTRLAAALKAGLFPADRVLVLLVSENLGKVLGNYATGWGTLEVNLIVVDEVPSRDAQFVRLGRLCEGSVPLWLYGMR